MKTENPAKRGRDLGFGLFLLVAEIFDTDVLHLAFKTSGFVHHRTHVLLVRKRIRILLPPLVVRFLWCQHSCMC